MNIHLIHIHIHIPAAHKPTKSMAGAWISIDFSSKSGASKSEIHEYLNSSLNLRP